MSMLFYLFALLLAALGLFSSGPIPTPDPPAALTLQSVTLGAERLLIPVAAGASAPDERTGGDAGCEIPSLGAEVGSGAEMRLQQVPADCEVGDQDPGNGNFGYFRTVDDVPDGEPVQTLDTALGRAEIVSYPYYECTNSCTDGWILAAILTLDDPADPGYPTIQIYQPVLISNGESQEVDLAGYISAIERA